MTIPRPKRQWRCAWEVKTNGKGTRCRKQCRSCLIWNKGKRVLGATKPQDS